MPDNPTANKAACAHKQVVPFTEEKNGTVFREYWACVDCRMNFTPYSNAPRPALSPAAAADYVLVPREPTEEMKIVGLQAFVYTAIKDRPENWKDIDHESPEYYLQMGREIMNSGYTDAAYKAMIAAAPKGDKHE